MTLKDLNIGDTFINSFGNKTTISNILPYSIKLKSEYGIVWDVSPSEFIDRVKKAKYSDYIPKIPAFKNMQVGDAYLNSCNTKCVVVEVIEYGKVIKLHNDKIGYGTLNKQEYNRYSNNWTNYKRAESHECTLSEVNTSRYNKWKVGPLNRKDAMKLIAFMGYEQTGISTSLKNNYFYYNGVDDFGKYTTNNGRTRLMHFRHSNLKELTLNQILNNSSNEKNRKIITGKRREISGQPITSNCTRKITSASRLIGNPISNIVKRTRVGGFKISPNAISA